MKLKTIIFFAPIPLVIFAYYILINYFFSPDVAYLLHASSQILAGGKYGADIFETNPPMILYLYSPAVLLKKLTTINVITSVKLYVTLLAVISLVTCFFLLKKLIKQQDKALRYCLFCTLVFCLLFLPAFSFAQREHILIIFMLPYLLSAALALENKSIHPMMAIFIGTMAGLGFALKPFFLVTPCLVELYFIVKGRRLFAWVRIETMVILSILILYLGSIFLFQPGYIHTVLPLVLRYYFSEIALTWNDIILFTDVLFGAAMVLGYLFYCKYDHYCSLGWVLALALLGMIIAYLVPQTPWYYHVMPSFALALLLVAHLAGQAITTTKQSYFIDKSFIICLLGIVFVLTLPAVRYVKVLKLYSKSQSQWPASAIAAYLNTQSGPRSIACFGLGTTDCFPLVYYAQSSYAERFPSFWWYQRLRFLETSKQPKEVMVQVEKDKKYFIDSFAEDLNRYKTRWVVIDLHHFQQLENAQFNVIQYFSANEKFRDVWRHYRYLTTIKSITIYERSA